MVTQNPAVHVFDRARLKTLRNRTTASLSNHDFLLKWSGGELETRLNDIRRSFSRILQIGAKPGLTIPPDVETLIVQDISRPLLCQSNGMCVEADEEFLPVKPGSLDLVISNLSLHSVNDLPGTLLQIRQALKPDGLFLAAMFGGETLHELRESLVQAEMNLKNGISPRVFPFADKQQMGALLQRAGFTLPVVDSEIVRVTYDNIFKLMHDVRGMGESNVIAAQNKTNPGKMLFMRAGEYYHEHYSDQDGRINASFEIIFLIGWAPHDSQQKPLRPGSAENRLADALKSEEQTTGEKVTP